MEIEAIPALSDNYIWMMQQKNKAVIVDPGEAQSVIKKIKEKNLELVAILLTHNHEDHTGGVKKLKKMYPNLPVYGPKETSTYVTHIISKENPFSIFGRPLKIYNTPGHTHGHLSYLVGNHLFCGDALFSAGCGRVFTEDYKAQYDTLKLFKSFDNKIKIYPAHEYTQTNLRFAKLIEPNHRIIEEYLKDVEKLQEQNLPTLPSTIGLEKEINVFLTTETLDDFVRLRKLRDDF